MSYNQNYRTQHRYGRQQVVQQPPPQLGLLDMVQELSNDMQEIKQMLNEIKMSLRNNPYQNNMVQLPPVNTFNKQNDMVYNENTSK